MILDSKNFNFEETAIIKPPFEQLKNVPLKYTRVVIDSRDRDVKSYPNPNNYVIELENEIEDVITGEIIIIQAPLSSYLINNNNNTFKVNGSVIVLEQGDYDATTLMNELNIRLSPLSITVSYSQIKNKYTFTSATTDFTISFSNYLSKILGFQKNEYTSNDNVLVPEYRVDFNVDKYIVLSIREMSINVSSNNNINKSTVIVSRGDSFLNSKANLTPIKKYFNPLIARLTKIHIKFKDYYGNDYDFQNQDHRIEIMYESKKQLNRYSTFI